MPLTIAKFAISIRLTIMQTDAPVVRRDSNQPMIINLVSAVDY
jgi:hypothetical protein